MGVADQACLGSEAVGQQTALDWWSVARGVSYDLASRVHIVGLSKAKQDSPALLKAKREFLHRHLLRLGLVASLQHMSWFRLRSRTDYLQAFREVWKESDGPYRFDQRLGMLFYSGLNQPAAKARDLVRAHVGEVPFLGTGLFNRERFEQEFDDGDGFAVVPDEIHGWFFEGGGLECAQSAGNDPIPEPLRQRCRKEVAAFLESDDALSQPQQDWPERLREIHAHDSRCGNGLYLAGMLVEICSAVELAEKSAGVAGADLVVTTLQRCLSGLEADLTYVQEARFRIAMVALLWRGSSKAIALPDLREVVRLGRPVSAGAGRGRLEESTKVEFKATFDWNVRKGVRDGDLRLGALRTVAAFLNTEGGVLYIGVDDSGSPLGLEADLDQIEDVYPYDIFEARVREFFKNHLDPVPLNAVRMDFPEMGGKTVCRIEVEGRPGVTYLLRKGNDGRMLEEVYVRDGNRTLNLTGRMRDQFVLGKSLS